MKRQAGLARTGYFAFFFSGVCAVSSGVIVNILQERYGFSFSLTGTMISMMCIGNMAASFAAGFLPGKIGFRNSAALLCIGYFLGYLIMALCGIPGILLAAFTLVGIAKGSAITHCTVLVGTNARNRTQGISLMHSCYAMGAMLCPFLISLLVKKDSGLPMYGISAAGLMMWLIFLTGGLPGKTEKAEGAKNTDYSFLKSGFFWLLTGLIFCQNAAELAVNGWLVTYYRTSGILSGTLSTYTVTIMWSTSLIVRLLIAFVFPIRDTFKTLAIMGLCCALSYLGLVIAGQPVSAIVMLVLFSISIAGVNPVGVAGVGQMMTEASVGVLLTISALGQILMPWIIGVAADFIGLQFAMALNLIPCLGIAAISLVIRMLPKKDT